MSTNKTNLVLPDVGALDVLDGAELLARLGPW